MRDFDGRELTLPSWEQAVADDWLGKWAMNLMLINVSTRKFRRAVRLPEGDVPAPAGSWGVEVGGLPAFRCAVGGSPAGVAGDATSPASTSWWCRSTASTSPTVLC